MLSDGGCIDYFRGRAQLDAFRSDWIPVEAWANSINSFYETEYTIRDLNCGFTRAASSDKVEVKEISATIYRHPFVVKTTAGTKNKRQFFYVQPKDGRPPPYPNDNIAAFWQKKYDLYIQRYPPPKEKKKKQQRQQTAADGARETGVGTTDTHGSSSNESAVSSSSNTTTPSNSTSTLDNRKSCQTSREATT